MRAGALCLALVLAGCSTTPKNTNVGKPSASERGSRVLEAVVVDRQFEPPGSGGSSLRGSGTWYLDFEARDGEATVHYHFPVSRQDYYRYAEGSRVLLVLSNDQLREIRPISK